VWVLAGGPGRAMLLAMKQKQLRKPPQADHSTTVDRPLDPASLRAVSGGDVYMHTPRGSNG
jgi:hypothetical protein